MPLKSQGVHKNVVLTIQELECVSKDKVINNNTIQKQIKSRRIHNALWLILACANGIILQLYVSKDVVIHLAPFFSYFQTTTTTKQNSKIFI